MISRSALQQHRWLRPGSRGLPLLLALCLAAGIGMQLQATLGHAEEAASGEAQLGTTGLPVPRFVSLKSGKVNVRRGPGTSYPVDWVFERRRLPLEIIAESDRWRKIRDRDGDTGWIWHSMLDGRRSGIVTGASGEPPRAIFTEPDPGAPVVAFAEPGVIAELKNCHGSWCEVEANGYKGYLPRKELWGTFPGEDFD
ncbi:MAG: hypothetical protein GC184_00305 [Rhizobiales bacterium]|nr:hypothetical protein [Hyphomicrobiales bacterium]